MSYIRDVIKAETIDGPRGGKILFLTLSCGHVEWIRGRRIPPKQRNCLICYQAEKSPTDPRLASD